MSDPTLPNDLTRLGWRLVTYPSGKLVATSLSWGCTGTKDRIEAVVSEARSLVKYIAWKNKQRAAGKE